MLKYGRAYLSTAIVFFILDFVWLSTMATSFYRDRLPDIVGTDVNYTAAVLFYLILVAGVIIFAVSPALQTGRWTTALVYGALFAWGTVASAISASLSYILTGWARRLCPVEALLLPTRFRH